MNDRIPVDKVRIPRLLQQSVEWYTPPKFIKAVRGVLGQIELDPASNAEANRIVQASRFFDQTMDGLRQPWKARSVFINPPYCKSGNVSNQELWTSKLRAEYQAGNIGEAIALVNAATETEWFQCLSSFPICFVKGRIRFLTSHSRTSNATIGSAFVYLGANGELFTQVFSQFGQIRYTIAPHKILYPGQLWETLPLPKKQQVLNYIVHLYTDYPAYHTNLRSRMQHECAENRS